MANTIDTNALTDLGLMKTQSSRVANSDLGEDAFLKLVIAQLQNQDPTKPMDNGEFLSQLAQFKSVSGIDELKNSVDNMATALQSNQALQASSLVGRWVMVPSTTNFLWSDTGMLGSVEVPAAATNVQVAIKDGTGQVVKTLGLGAQGVGTANYQWDGVGDDGTVYAAGDYSVEARANIGGNIEVLDANTIVPVESVLMGKTGEGMTVSTAGLGNVKLSDVKQIM